MNIVRAASLRAEVDAGEATAPHRIAFLASRVRCRMGITRQPNSCNMVEPRLLPVGVPEVLTRARSLPPPSASARFRPTREPARSA